MLCGQDEVNANMTPLQAAAGGLKAQLASYRELRDNFSEGARFYTALQEAVKTLAQQAGDYVLTRRLQRCGGGLESRVYVCEIS